MKLLNLPTKAARLLDSLRIRALGRKQQTEEFPVMTLGKTFQMNEFAMGLFVAQASKTSYPHDDNRFVLPIRGSGDGS